MFKARSAEEKVNRRRIEVESRRTGGCGLLRGPTKGGVLAIASQSNKQTSRRQPGRTHRGNGIRIEKDASRTDETKLTGMMRDVGAVWAGEESSRE